MVEEQRPEGLEALDERALHGDSAPSETGSVTVSLQDARSTVARLRERFDSAVLLHEVVAGDEHVVFIIPERNLGVLAWLKDEPAERFDLLADVTAVDYGGGRPLQVVYQLWSIPHRKHLRVKCELPLTRLEIDSVVRLWKTADWLEREVYDLFGVEFKGHPDLRRILMPENYAEGHPLRKDFPLRGRFTRAEQTRRALSQDPHDYYISAELEMGGDPQTVEGVSAGGPELPGEAEDNR